MIQLGGGLRLLILFCGLLSAVQTEVKTVRGREGETVTLCCNITDLQTHSVMWFFSPDTSYTVIALLYRGIPDTNYSERFRDRLQLDRQTGYLTISNLNTKDSGVYKLQTRTSEDTSRFNLIVYTPVSEPVVRKSAHIPDTTTMRPDQRNIYMWPLVLISAVLTVMIIGSAIFLKKQRKSRKTGQEFVGCVNRLVTEVKYAQVLRGTNRTPDSETESRAAYTCTHHSPNAAAVPV